MLKKIIVYILILSALVAPLSVPQKTYAQTPTGDCLVPATANRGGSTDSRIYRNITQEQCASYGATVQWTQTTIIAAQSGDKQSAIEALIDKECGIVPFSQGCILKLFYIILHTLPAGLLWLSAYFFNSLVSIGLDSTLTSSSAFIPAAWKVVRDISNIFFILVLLYIALQTILGLGSHTGPKKAIAQVIIMALLINFSMFFTKVVIDSANILALIFYNKLQVTTSEYTPSSLSRTEKDISGSLVKNFDPTQLISEGVIQKAKVTRTLNRTIVTDEVPFGILLLMIFIGGAVMLVAAYAFFIAGFSFLGRLVELWILIIFAPFAFMSSVLPVLSKAPGIGWTEWTKKLIATAFMAPIFMFFMYLIFQIMRAGEGGMFAMLVRENEDLASTVLAIVIPAAIILTMLLKATDYAKKGGGQFGEMALKGGMLLGGLALGAATGGASLAATASLGRIGAAAASSNTLRAAAAGGNKSAQRKLAIANSLAKGSFDVRQTGIGKFVANKTGLDVNRGLGFAGLNSESLKGGFQARIESKAKAEEEKLKTYQLTKEASVAQDRRAAVAKSQNNRATQYEKDRDEARGRVEVEGGGRFDEEEFKEAYERGGRIALLGKEVEGGSVNRTEEVNTAKEENEVRRQAYANSRETEGEKGLMRSFFREWGEGMAKMATTPGGLTATIIAGIPTAGVGSAAAVVGGGLLYAMKEKLFNVGSSDAEVVGSLRKGEDPLKKVVEDLKKVTEGHEEKKEESTHSEPKASETPTPETGDSHSGDRH